MVEHERERARDCGGGDDPEHDAGQQLAPRRPPGVVRAWKTARAAGDGDDSCDAGSGDDRGEHLTNDAHAFEPSPPPRGTDLGARRVVDRVGSRVVPLC